MQDTQILKREIITLLDSLPEDGISLLAEFSSFLRSKYATKNNDINNERTEPEFIDLSTATKIQHQPARMYSPRLANPAQISDFELEVTHEAPNDVLNKIPLVLDGPNLTWSEFRQ